MLSTNLAMAQEQPTKQYLAEFLIPLLEDDSFGPLLEINEADDTRLSELLSFLQHEQNEYLIVPVAKLQLNYLLEKAKRPGQNDSEGGMAALAKVLDVAYFLSVITWPGRGNQSQPISLEDQHLGRQAAEMVMLISSLTWDQRRETLRAPLKTSIFWRV